MNEKQKKVVLVSILFIVLACLFPPSSYSYSDETFVFFLDAGRNQISFAKLFIECMVITILSLFLIFFLNKNNKLFLNKKGRSKTNFRCGIRRIIFVLSMLGTISATYCSLDITDYNIRYQKNEYEQAKQDLSLISQFWDAWVKDSFKDKHELIRYLRSNWQVEFENEMIESSRLFPYPFLSDELVTMPSNLLEERAYAARQEAVKVAIFHINEHSWIGKTSSNGILLLMISAALVGAIIGYLSVWVVLWYGGLLIYSFFRWIADGFSEKITIKQNDARGLTFDDSGVLDSEHQSTKTDDDVTMRETMTIDIPSEKDFATHKENDIDEPKTKQLGDIPPFVSMLGIDEDCDELPNAQGEFGLVPTNPIPVNSHIGETVYINKLRSKTGVGFLYHRLGSVQTSVTNKPVDLFELVSVDAMQKVKLYFDIYHPRRSTKCPKDLNLLSWQELSKELRIMCKINSVGITSGRVSNFPYDLPKHIENSEELASISPGLPQSMARKVKEIIDSHINQW